MDNISGSANWKLYDIAEPVEEEVKEEVIEFKPFDKKLFCEIVKEAQLEYKVTKKKNLGDVLVCLEMANKLLS